MKSMIERHQMGVSRVWGSHTCQSDLFFAFKKKSEIASETIEPGGAQSELALDFIGEQPGLPAAMRRGGPTWTTSGRLLRDRGGRRHPLSPPSTADRARFGHSDSREQSSARPTPSGRDHPSVHRPRTGVFTPVRRSPPASHDPQSAHALLYELARSRRRSFDSEPKSATATPRCRVGPSTAQAQPRGRHRVRSEPALGAELAVVVRERERKSKSRRLVTFF